MKKSLICICLMVTLVFSTAITTHACWMQPEPFEIFSEDGNRVFVFVPYEDGTDVAYAALYEIVGNKRTLIYTVSDLSSFAYEGNFYFSKDMEHFARVFPPYGIPTFEVFSNGVRTRVVYRYDFIKDYQRIVAELSIGPQYTKTWQIENNNQHDNMITIITDEDKNFLFNLETAEFEANMLAFGSRGNPTTHRPVWLILNRRSIKSL